MTKHSEAPRLVVAALSSLSLRPILALFTSYVQSLVSIRTINRNDR